MPFGPEGHIEKMRLEARKAGAEAVNARRKEDVRRGMVEEAIEIDGNGDPTGYIFVFIDGEVSRVIDVDYWETR